MQEFSDDLLELYYRALKSKFQPGKDRITPSKFALNKDNEFNLIKRKVASFKYKFTKLKEFKISSGRHVCIPTIRDRIIIEILKDRIKSKYRIRYNNRDQIIKTIISKLKGDSPFFVVRLDIKNFFQSIPQDLMLEKLKNNSLFNIEEYVLIERIINLRKSKGIPQGLSISNILSEIYLESFDAELKKIHKSVNYYTRFVDDILILINGNVSPSAEVLLKDHIKSVFKKFGLNTNLSKEKYIAFLKNNSFEYLGYEFSRCNGNILKSSICKGKLCKIYKKIDRIFEEYSVNQNDNLLVERLKYLTYKKSLFKEETYIYQGSKIVRRKRKIYFGLLESYKEISDEFVWRKLDQYIKGKIITAKYKNLISKSLSKKLHAYSFSLSAKKQNLYKMNKLTKMDFVELLLHLNTDFDRSMIMADCRPQLIRKYFKMVDIKL